MTKMLATLIALTTLAATSATAIASDAAIPTFDAAIQYDASAPVETIYTSIKAQSHTACKRQIRSVKSLSIRQAYLKSCKAELMEAAVKKIEMDALRRYYAQQNNKPVTEKIAQMTR